MLASRVQNLEPEGAYHVLARAQELERQGRDIIHLEIGEPDYDTPRHIVDAAVNAFTNGYTHYTPAAGMIDIRRMFAESTTRDRGVDIKPENILLK